jgi:hypothetical protein
MKKSRTSLVVGGIISAVLAVGLIVAGGALVWADHEKDSDGYLTTTEHRFAAKTAALSTENIDVDLDGADWVVSENHLGKVRLKADPANGKDVFVGIARTSDVERYLGGVPYTTVNDIDVTPFRADYERHSGNRHPVAPEHAGIWQESSQGTGKQSINWKIDDGDYSVVVMNADGSLGVDADVTAGANIPFLDELGWSAIGSGAFALILGIGLIALAARKTRTATA